MKEVFIIGGGASGLMSAICASRNGFKVVLLEKNDKIGKKLFITGKGRCNLTNSSSVQNHLENTVRNSKFMNGALRLFDSADCMAFFEELGVPLKTERGNRVFPVSDKSSDIIKALQKEIARLSVDVHLNEKVTSIAFQERKVLSITTDKKVYSSVDYVIICTGGITYPATGSTGDGYAFAQKAGHSIVDPKPSLCDITLKENYNLAGVCLKNVEGSIEDRSGKVYFSEFGEMLFTDKGVGGPVVLSLSARSSRMDITKLNFCIDLKPALNFDTLDKRILRDFEEQNNKQIKNILGGLVPKSLIPLVLRQSKINGDRMVNSIQKEERKQLLLTLKHLILPIQGFDGIERAVITSGGVDVTEIIPKNMRSKFIDNLAFAGEIIDVDAFTGGFNLQIAFSTAYVAGNNIE